MAIHSNPEKHQSSREHVARAGAARTRNAGIDRPLLKAVQQWDVAYTFALDAPPYACRIF